MILATDSTWQDVVLALIAALPGMIAGLGAIHRTDNLEQRFNREKQSREIQTAIRARGKKNGI